MGEGSLTWEDCWPVVEAEARRWRRAGEEIGLDPDDLTQEASIAAVQCVGHWRPDGGGRVTYVRTAIRNRFADVRKQALRQRRVPHDAAGRPRPEWVGSYDALSADNELQSLAVFDKGRIESRQALQVLRDRLPRRDWEFLVQSLVQGAHLARGLAPAQRQQLQGRLREIQGRARRILSGILTTHEEQPMNVAIPKPAREELPECHAAGPQPQGYDREDPVCWNCRDKFTCLPTALDKSLVVGSLEDDSEIYAVHAEEMSFRTAIERMKARLRVTQAGGEVPTDLDVRTPIAETGVRPVPMPEPEPVAEEPPEAPEPPPEPVAKEPAPTPPPPKKRPPAPAPGLVNAEGLPTLKNGKPLPPIRQLSAKQMKAALARIKVGQGFPLDVGMQLVRKTKDGDNIIVQLVPTGFRLDGVVYSSISTAIMYRLRKVTSGNAYFNIATHQCTEIWSEKGEVLAGYSTS